MSCDTCARWHCALGDDCRVCDACGGAFDVTVGRGLDCPEHGAMCEDCRDSGVLSSCGRACREES